MSTLGTTIVSTRYGEMEMINADPVISAGLSLYGEWAEHELALLNQLITAGMHVVDVGAFIGTHTLAFAQFVGEQGQVYAFEPRREIHAILANNVARNSLSQVHVIHAGLAETAKKLKLTTMDIQQAINFGGLALTQQAEINQLETYAVDVITLDSLAIQKIDVIKIDAEGMEINVLQGATHTLSKNRPIVFCECNSLQGGADVLSFFGDKEYVAYAFLSSAYNENNCNQAKENIFGEAKELGVLFFPVEKKDEILNRVKSFSLLPIHAIEDLVLPLLHKPQYVYEVLKDTSAAPVLGINFPSPLVVGMEYKLIQQQQAKENAEKLAFSRYDELNQLTQQFQAIQQAKDSVEQLALSRQSEIQKISQHFVDMQEAKESAEQLALSRYDEIKVLSQHLREMKSAKELAEELALSRQSEIQKISQHFVDMQEAKESAEQLALSRYDEIKVLSQHLREMKFAKELAEELALSRQDEVQKISQHFVDMQEAKKLAEQLAFSRYDEVRQLMKQLNDAKINFQFMNEMKKMNDKTLDQLRQEINCIKNSVGYRILCKLGLISLRQGKINE